jgi:RecA/RadA recombinase
MRLHRKSLEEVEIDTEPQFTLVPKSLDAVLGRLLIPCQISLLHGPTRAPLTALAHLATVCAAKGEGQRSVYLHSGNNYSPNLARALCGRSQDPSAILQRIVVGRVLSLSDIEQELSQIDELGKVRLVVVDSLTSVLELSENAASAARQRKLFHALEMLRSFVNRSTAHLMMTDHSSPDWGSGQTTPIGGNVVAHNVDSVVRVQKLDIVSDELVSLLVERCPLPEPPTGVVVRMSPKTISSIK